LSPRPIEFPVEGLSDGSIRLRLMTDADVPAVIEAIDDPLIPRFTRVPHPYGVAEARHFQRSGAAGASAGTDLATLIVDAGDDSSVLGAAGLHNLDPESGRCSAGYWVTGAARGRGVATAAMRLLTRYAFDELAVQRIELWIEPVNVASLRVAERTGFAREGLLRSFMHVGGERRDMLMYSLLPSDLD